MIHPRSLATCLLAICLFVTSLLVIREAGAQDKKKEAVCPWCKNDIKIMEPAGIVSHGPFPMGKKDTNDVKRLPAEQWIFLETKHLRFATSLGQQPIPLNERPRVEAELDRLRKFFPNIPKKLQQLDPWLRIHLTAMKGEELFDKFTNMLKVKDADFPESRAAVGPYMGDGRFLGEREKFEIIMHADRRTHHLFTEDHMGVRTTDALRWHFKEPHHLTVSIAAVDDLIDDKYLFPHVAHNLTHLWFCAYKHFSFDPPYWLDEGIAHLFEIESFKDLNITYCSDEGAGPDREKSKDWLTVVKTLVDKKKAPTFADLLHKKNFGDLTREDHVTIWAKVKFLKEEHGEKFAKFLGAVKGRLDDAGFPTGKDLPGYQRQLLKELWNWTPDALDRDWETWIKKQKPQ